jgi:hypothetical protein
MNKGNNMKQDFTVYTYKADKRTKSGERLINTRVIVNVSKEELLPYLRELAEKIGASNIAFYPTKGVV